MTSLRDAAAARREKRRYKQVVREAHSKDDNAIANLKALKEGASYSKEQDPEDVVKGTMIETKADPGSMQKITPFNQLSSETKSGESGDDFEKQKLLQNPGGEDTDESRKTKEEFRSLHSVSMYIIENLITFLDFFQQLGLVWALSVLVDWPKDFLRGSVWILIFNMDISTIIAFTGEFFARESVEPGKVDEHLSPWGELRGAFLLYSFLWSLLGLLVIGLVVYMWTHQWYRGTLGHENKREILMNRVRHSLFWVTYNMAVPLLLSLLRPFRCEQRTMPDIKYSEDGRAIKINDLKGKYVMAFDSAENCLTASHILACVWYGLVALAFVVGLYFSLYQMVQPQAVYKHSENHERYIQQKECEYILGINHDYIVFHHSFFFSFRRRYVHFRLIRFTEKLLLILAYLFPHLIQIQTVSFWVVIFVFAVFYTVARPFRAPASNVALCLCQYTILLHALLLAAKGSNYDGQAVVNSNLRYTLTVLDSVGFGLALAVFIGGGIYSDWKPMVIDPIDQPRVNRGEDVRRWVKEIKQFQEFIRANSLRPYEFIVVTPLEQHLQELSKCFHEAQRAEHIVQYTLLDVAQEAEYFLEEIREKNLMPNPTLEEALLGARPLLDRVDETMALVDPVRQRFLRNLQALRLFRIGYHGPHENSDEEDLTNIDLEKGQDFDIEELKDATYRALIPPMDKDELFEIKAKWRGCIQRWKANFVTTKGRDPTLDEMWVISTERKNYAMVSSAYNQLHSRRK